MSKPIYDFAANKIDGTPSTLADHKGDVLLIVNVASKCGLTPQYEGLENLYETYGAKGFKVLGFPANEFAGQEPGSNAEIQDFCTTNYGVKFPMYEKIVVKGAGQHPLYAYLTKAQPKALGNADEMRANMKARGVDTGAENDILWNFEKFLVSRDGDVVARFAPRLAPSDPLIVQAVEAEIAKHA